MTQIFKATRSTSQTGIASATYTIVQLDTAAVNEGGYFNTSTYEWMPPAGAVAITGKVEFSSGVTTTSPDNEQVRILKNGSPIGQDTGGEASGAGGSPGILVTVYDRANGADVYSLQCYGLSDSTLTLNGNSNKTCMSGIAFEA